MVEKSYYHINKSLQEFKKVLGVNNTSSDNENGGYKESDNGAGSGCQASHTSLADTVVMIILCKLIVKTLNVTL